MDNAGAWYGSLGEDQHLWKGDLLLLRRTKLEVSHITDSMTYLNFSPWNFQITNFRKVSKEFHLDYDKLEDRPSLPQQNGAATAGNAPGNSTAGTGASSATNGPPLPNAPPQPQPTGPSPVMQFGGGGSGPGMSGFVTYVDLVSPNETLFTPNIPFQYQWDRAVRGNTVPLYRASQTTVHSEDRTRPIRPPSHWSRDARRSWSSLRLCDQPRDFILSSNHCFYPTGQHARRARRIWGRKDLATSMLVHLAISHSLFIQIKIQRWFQGVISEIRSRWLLNSLCG